MLPSTPSCSPYESGREPVPIQRVMRAFADMFERADSRLQLVGAPRFRADVCADRCLLDAQRLSHAPTRDPLLRTVLAQLLGAGPVRTASRADHALVNAAG